MYKKTPSFKNNYSLDKYSLFPYRFKEVNDSNPFVLDDINEYFNYSNQLMLKECGFYFSLHDHLFETDSLLIVDALLEVVDESLFVNYDLSHDNIKDNYSVTYEKLFELIPERFLDLQKFFSCFSKGLDRLFIMSNKISHFTKDKEIADLSSRRYANFIFLGMHTEEFEETNFFEDDEGMEYEDTELVSESYSFGLHADGRIFEMAYNHTLIKYHFLLKDGFNNVLNINR